MSDVVWSINIMCAILLVLVGISIYWIFKYDSWYPNPVVHDDIPVESGRTDTGVQDVGVGAE